MPKIATATDLALKITQVLRSENVVGKFVEYFGPGPKSLSLTDRALVANMAPEYGATCGYFPIDDETLNYMRLTNRDEEHIQVTEAYTKANHLSMIQVKKPSILRLLKSICHLLNLLSQVLKSTRFDSLSDAKQEFQDAVVREAGVRVSVWIRKS